MTGYKDITFCISITCKSTEVCLRHLDNHGIPPNELLSISDFSGKQKCKMCDCILKPKQKGDNK